MWFRQLVTFISSHHIPQEPGAVWSLIGVIRVSVDSSSYYIYIIYYPLSNRQTCFLCYILEKLKELTPNLPRSCLERYLSGLSMNYPLYNMEGNCLHVDFLTREITGKWKKWVWKCKVTLEHCASQRVMTLMRMAEQAGDKQVQFAPSLELCFQFTVFIFRLQHPHDQ